MVYVVNSEYAVEPFKSVKGRNVLFTAITRSRAWVHICGCGNGMKELISELEAVRDSGYQLRFSVPTPEQLASIRKIHRDMSEAEISKRNSALKGAQQFLALLESGELPPEALPEDLIKRIQTVIGNDNDTE